MKNTILKALAAAALLLGAPSLFAQNLTVPAASGTINGVGQTFAVNFTPGADSGGFDFMLTAAPAANLTITAATAVIPNGTTVCSVAAALVSCFSNANAPTVDLGAGVITVTYTAGPTAGPINLNFGMANFFDQLGGTEPGTTTNGILTLSSGPSAPTVGPLAATTLSVGPINLTATGNVAVAITGTGVAPASLALACTIPATGASAFAIASGGAQTITAPAVVGAGTPIGVSCTRGAADAVATLTCTRTAVPASVLPDLTAVVTCPAGTVAANPGSSPAAPGPVSLIGAPGGTATGGVTFTNVGGTAAYTVTGCAPSAGYTTATIFPVTVGIAGTGAVSVSCVAPAAAGTSLPVGTLACTTSAVGFNPTFNLSCTSQSASIPTLGNAGKALMVLLMLGFGLVGFQLYRRSA